MAKLSKQKFLVIFLILIFSSLVLAACGDASPKVEASLNNTTPAPATPVPPTPVATIPPDPTVTPAVTTKVPVTATSAKSPAQQPKSGPGGSEYPYAGITRSNFGEGALG